jgi:glc operon protein GlcG
MKEPLVYSFRQRGVIAVFGLMLVAWPARTGDDKSADAPLITRGRVQLNLAGAEKIIGAAKQKATAMELKINIAVVDDGGHLLAFARMDGARPASAYTAQTKAATAATFRQETGPLPPKGEPDILLNLSLQNAAAASGGKLTTLKGGVPVVIDGQVVGAVGVGGGTGEQDAEVAKAGIQALLDGIREKK